MQANPCLFLNGNCETAFKFYEQVLGGKIEGMMTHEGSPAADHVPAEWRKKIMHARMILDNGVLMGSDAPPRPFHQPQGFSINLAINDPADAQPALKGLSTKRKVVI